MAKKLGRKGAPAHGTGAAATAAGAVGDESVHATVYLKTTLWSQFFPSLSRFWGSYSGHQACITSILPADPSHQTYKK